MTREEIRLKCIENARIAYQKWEASREYPEIKLSTVAYRGWLNDFEVRHGHHTEFSSLDALNKWLLDVSKQPDCFMYFPIDCVVDLVDSIWILDGVRYKRKQCLTVYHPCKIIQ